MNFRKNNGFTGIDISISMIIILIFIPTVFGIVYNIQKTNVSVKRESKAVSIAIDVLEIAKSKPYDAVKLEASSDFLTSLNKNYSQSTYTNSSTEESDYEYIYYSLTGEDDEHYQIQIGLQNYYPSSTEQEDLIKKIKVTVFYPVGNMIENIDISTVLQNT